VDTVGRAIKIIQKEMNKNPASFAQVASKGFVNVMNSLSTIVDAAGLSSSDQHHLTALVQSQQSSSDDDSELGAPAAAAYTSKSSGIVDTLEDLKEKADAELAELRKAESAAKHNFEMLKQSLSDQLDADNKDLDSEKTDKAAAEEDKATAEGDLSVTSGALTNAQEELETANKNCMQVAADHGATVASRSEELKVIAEATQIVKDSTGGASDQTYSLLQVSGSAHVELARSEIVTLVKSLARKQHSAGLAQLASRITAVMRYGTTGGDDPFIKVKGLINDMIAKLEKEAAEAADEKKFCDEEMGKTKAKKDDLDSTVEKLTTKINQDSSKSVELKNDVKELESELAALASDQAEMDNMRQKDHAEFVQAKKDL
jgi:chromosome segregation ATPase